MTQYIEVIKTTKAYVKNEKIYLDYRVMPHLRRGKDRERFSTGMKATKENLRYVEKHKLRLAYEHFDQNKNPDAQTSFGNIAFEALRAEASNRSKQLQLDYENIYKKKIAPKFAKMRIGDIKAAHINQWKNDLIAKGISKSRFHTHHTTFNMILKYAYENEFIDQNPMNRVPRKSKQFKQAPDKSNKYYSPDEVKLILENATGMLKPLLTFLFHTGARTGEALALQWEYVNFDDETITIAHSITDGVLKSTKTGKVRVVDMTKELKKALLEYKDACISKRWVFPSSTTGKPHYDSNSIVRNSFKKLLERLGIEYRTLYATRHSFASNLIAKKAPIPYVQHCLGHASPNTTLQYYTRNGHIVTEGKSKYLENLYG